MREDMRKKGVRKEEDVCYVQLRAERSQGGVPKLKS